MGVDFTFLLSFKGMQVKKAAKLAGIPLFSLNSNSNMALAKAVQSLMGLTPSTSFPAKPTTETVGEERRQRTNREQKDWKQQIKEDRREQTKEEREERQEMSMAESEALDEVRFAIEDIILPRNQTVELMPQLPHILQIQVGL